MGTLPNATGTGTVVSMHLNGHLQGGQQPVASSKVYLYATSGTTGGAATSLLNGAGYVVTDGGGNFSITGDYTCPAGAFVYILALGGNPGLSAGTNNAKLALSANVGACSSQSSATYISVNEVTTVAMAAGIAPIAVSETAVGSADSYAVTNAVTLSNNLASTASGIAPMFSPDGGEVPQAKVNSLADSIAACVNSDGTGQACSTLMADAGLAQGGSTAQDTFNAALRIAQNPTQNVSSIYNLAAQNGPFQPTLSSAPSDWALSVQYAGGGYGGGSSPHLTPASATVAQGSHATFTLASPPTGALSYRWTTSARAGSLSDTIGGPQTSYCTLNTTTTYTAGSSNASTLTDGISVTAYSGPACIGSMLANLATEVTVPAPTANALLPGGTTQTFTATIVLPSGVTLPLDSLSVQDSLATTTPASSGTFTIPRYAGGPQIVIVKTPDGTPMLLGWMDANHSTVSASTTAEVLAYYALGGELVLTETDRESLIAQMPQLSGSPNLATVVAGELASNPDAFGQADTNVQQAVSQIFTATTGVTPSLLKSTAKPLDVTINPGSDSAQSGISLSATEPAPPYFTSVSVDPYSTFLTNAYRRRTHAFVLQQKDTLNGNDVPVNTPVTDFEVPPTVGLNGGVTGAVTDIIKAYFGNQPTAYAPSTVDPPFDLPVDAGFDSTTYQVINVGPGGSGKPFPVALTAAQNLQLVQTSVNGFCADFVVPIINNIVINGSADPDVTANTPISGSTRSAFVLNLEKNFANLLSGISADQDKLVAGDYKGVFKDLFLSAGTYPLVSDAITKSLIAAAPNVVDATQAKGALDSFTRVMNTAGAVLQGFDSLVYVGQIANSDNVDLWTITSTRFVAKLTPATNTINGVGSVQLTGSVLAVTNTNNLSYKFTLSPASGQSLIGALSGSGGSVPDASGNLSFCASSPIVVYANNAAAVAALSYTGTDTVSMTVYQGGNCQSANQLSSAATAVVTTNPGDSVTLAPADSVISPGDQVTLTATLHTVNNTDVANSFQWTLSGNNGTVTEVNGTAQMASPTYCSPSGIAKYQSTTTLASLSANATDVVAVNAYSSTDCSGNVLGATQTTVTASARPRLRISPPTSTIVPNASVTVSAAVNTAIFPNAPAVASYQWTSTGNYGNVSGQPAGAASFCSTSNQLTYTATSPSSITALVQDTLTVIGYAHTGCMSGDEVTLQGSGAVITQPQAAGFPLPINTLLQGGDGNLYATAGYSPQNNTYGTCSAQSNDFCSYILKITPSHQVTVLHTFRSTYGSVDPDDPAGASLTRPIEAADGNLYGTTTMGGSNGGGSVYRLGHDGTFSVIYAPGKYVTYGYVGSTENCLIPGNGSNSYGSTTSHFGIAAIGPLTESSDGNFYAIAQHGSDDNVEGGAFLSISPSGTLLEDHDYDYLRGFTFEAAGGLQCGDSANGPDFDFSAEPSEIVQAASHTFYTQSYGNGKVIGITQDGAQTAVASAPSGLSFGPGTERLIVGADSMLYGLAQDTSLYKVDPVAGRASTVSSAQTYGATNPTFFLGSDDQFYSSVSTSQMDGIILRFQPDGSHLPVYDPASLANTVPFVPNALLELSDGSVAGNATTYNSSTYTNSYSFFDVPVSTGLAGAIHLSFPTATAAVNKPILLTWSVTNAFSLTAQQCHATVQTPATGSAANGGNWSGPQVGSMSGSVYTGSAAIVPSAAGTYTYALTCGGTQSGTTTLTVQ